MSTLGLRLNQDMTRVDAAARKLVAMSLRLFPTYEPGFGLGIRASIELTALYDGGGDSAFPDGMYELVQLDAFSGAEVVEEAIYQMIEEIYADVGDRDAASLRLFGYTEYITPEAAAVVYRWLSNGITERAKVIAAAEPPEIPF
jgi:hypothetical protein